MSSRDKHKEHTQTSPSCPNLKVNKGLFLLGHWPALGEGGGVGEGGVRQVQQVLHEQAVLNGDL